MDFVEHIACDIVRFLAILWDCVIPTMGFCGRFHGRSFVAFQWVFNALDGTKSFNADNVSWLRVRKKRLANDKCCIIYCICCC